MLSAWSTVEHRQLRELAGRGLTATEIASRLGRSRSAVLGRAFRNGIELPMAPRKHYRGGRPGRRAPSPSVVCAGVLWSLGFGERRAAVLVGLKGGALRRWVSNPAFIERTSAVASRVVRETRITPRLLTRLGATQVAKTL